MKNILIVFLLLAMPSYSQNESDLILKRSPLTDKFIGELPFDQSFFIEERLKENGKIVSLEVYKWRNGKLNSYTKKEKEHIRNFYGTDNVDLSSHGLALITINSSHYNVKENKAYIKIFALAPATHYEFVTTKKELAEEKATPKNIRIILDAMNVNVNELESARQSKFASIDITNAKGKNLYATEIYSRRVKGKVSKGVALLLNYDSRREDFGQELKEKISELVRVADEDLDAINLKNAFESCYKEQLALMVECDTCEKRLVTVCRDTCFNVIFYPSNEMYDFINEGLLSITNVADRKLKDPLDFAGRASNIEKTINYIEKLLLLSDNPLIDECQALINERSKLHKNLVVLTKLANGWTEVVNEITEYTVLNSQPLESFSMNDGLGMTGGGITMESKGQFVVRPDFGVAFASSVVGINSPTGAFTKVAPFGGVRINLRPLNHNIPYRLIPHKSIWHHLSINLALTTNSFSDDLTRFDLFGKTNFVLGAGYRINNGMNLSSGLVFYQRLNPDPFINTNRLAVMPYVGVTVDFEILETFNSLISGISK